jgi:hypothetical protein
MIPVIDNNQKPLMPCSEKRARKMIESKKATPFWKKGVFCIRLNQEPSARNLQPIVVGIDPGSKKEGCTVKSEAHTLLNINADAVTWVKFSVETRRMMRKNRRRRKTPCRKRRLNNNYHKPGWLAPSTRARWEWKIRICNWLVKMYPITDFVIEDIKANSNVHKGFSILETSKKWFYKNLTKLGVVYIRQGWETKELRDSLGLFKVKEKLAEVFEAHCVDSWVLANCIVGGHSKPENTRLLCITPIRLHRRQLHYLQPERGGFRKTFGGTSSCGLKRGSYFINPKCGAFYLGGEMNGKITMLSIIDGKRKSQKTNPLKVKFKSYNTWKRHVIA